MPHDVYIIIGIFGSLYMVSLSREMLRQKRCKHCKASLLAAAGAAIGEACYAFSGETILYFLMK